MKSSWPRSPAGRRKEELRAASGGPSGARVSLAHLPGRSTGLRGKMVLGVNMASTLFLLCLLLFLRPVPTVAYSVSLPATFLEDMGGSGDAEGSSASSPSLPSPRTPAFSPTSGGPQPTSLQGPAPPTNLLDGIKDFFRQYVMLIAVVGSLAFLLMFIVCAALITRQKHKATAYYPSSFPKKKYVDQSDRAGGPRIFSEVPDRAPDSRPEEALDSSQQFQADILAATQNLRSPSRATPGSGDVARPVEGGSEGQVTHNQDGQEAPAQAVPEVLCSVEPEGAATASEGQGGPEGSFSLAQEPPEPMGPLEGPCVCSSVSPSV